MQPERRKRPSGCGSSTAAISLPSRRYDLLATACWVTAVSIHDGITRAAIDGWDRKRHWPRTTDEMIVSGGGTKNEAIMSSLAAAAVSLTTTDEFGVPSDAKEAIAFALLEAGRIDRLVIIAEQGLDGPPELGGALDDPADHASHPLLIVGASESADDVTERVARFLQDSGARLP